MEADLAPRNVKIYNISLKLSVLATALWSGTLAVVLSDIISNYALAGTEEGLMSSMISFGALAALLVSIFFFAKLKKTQIIIGFGFITSAILVIQGIPMPFLAFLLACFGMGLGHGTVDSYQSSFLADLNPGNTAKHMGSLHGVFGVGGVLTPIILHELLKSLPWRTIYLITGIACFILIAQFAAVSRYMKHRVSVAGRVEQKLTAGGIKEFFKNRYSVYLLLCIFFGAAAQSGIIVWTIRYVSVSLNSPEIAAVCLSIFWIASTVSRFVSPRLPAKPSSILFFGAFISAVTWAVALAFNHALGLCIASGITGLASGSCIPLTLSEGACVHPERTGFSTNILMMFKTAGQILSPVFVAFIMSLGSMRAGMAVTSVFFAVNGIFAIMMARK